MKILIAEDEPVTRLAMTRTLESWGYEVLQADESYQETRSSEIGALIEYTKAVGRVKRARQGYLGGGMSAAIPIDLSSLGSMGAGGLPAGIDAGMIQQYSSMLPAGIDINMLQSFLP